MHYIFFTTDHNFFVSFICIDAYITNKNNVVKINSGLKSTYINLQFGTTTYAARAITWIDETEVQCLCNAVYHRRMLKLDSTISIQ